MSRILYTKGDGKFVEDTWIKDDCDHNQIAVKSIFTGVCRSDIDMMNGEFGPLPISMSGHEGLGQVIAVGGGIDDVKPGDYVATRGEPAYADYYNVRRNEYVKVPEADPKYIIEPVACGINVVHQSYKEIQARAGAGKRLLILGSGFLAWVAYNAIKFSSFDFEIDVIGSSNRDLWGDILKSEYSGEYDVIIDLSPRNDVFEKPIYRNDALIIMGTQKTVTTDFSDMLWKAVTITFPSPRNPKFHNCMENAVEWIQDGRLNVGNFWTRGYDRDSEWEQAFKDGLERPKGYSRGYIKWA